MFKDYARKDYLTLFFDNLNASQREGTLLDQLNEALDEKGYSCIVTSEKMTPKAVNDMYGSRNASEK